MHCKSFSHFFNKTFWHISDINTWSFNETLINEVVSFEQLALERQQIIKYSIMLDLLDTIKCLVLGKESLSKDTQTEITSLAD